MTLLRAKEILGEDVLIKKTFNERQVGSLFWLGLVRGKKLPRYTLICLEDVKKMAEFKKQLGF